MTTRQPAAPPVRAPSSARALTAIVAALAALVTLPALAPSSAVAAPPKPRPTAPTKPTKPEADTALVELVEVGDLQCPFCARAQAAVAAVRAKYGARLAFRWLHQPLSFHEYARPAAIAVEAARRQGKLDPMLAVTFAHQSDLTPAALRRYADKAGLDLARYDAALVDAEVAAAVDGDQRLATAIGATGTPTFFVNGVKIPGAVPREQLEAAIDEELAAAAEAPDKAGGPEWRKARAAENDRAFYGYLFGGWNLPSAKSESPPAADQTIYAVPVDPSLDAVLGPTEAPVTLVVFTDYQCPFCRKLEPTLAALRAKYPRELRVVVRHNPLPFHKDALPAAKLAVCAEELGAFAKVHAAILGVAPDDLGTTDLRALAVGAGVDGKKLDRCLAERAADRVRRDLEAAAAASARGTPNTFVNGRKVTGARPLETFVALVDEELDKAKARLAAGTSLHDLYPAVIGGGVVVSPLADKVNRIDEVGAPRLGPADAMVRVAFFGDLECPFSAKAFPLLQRLVDAFPGRLSVTFHHFPLSFHPQAMPAAEAAACAAEQNRFWPFVAAVFERQRDLATGGIEAAADAAHVDRKRFAACRADAATGPGAELIERQMQNARAAGLQGTPTLYINGRLFTPPSGYDLVTFETVIDRYFPDAR